MNKQSSPVIGGVATKKTFWRRYLRSKWFYFVCAFLCVGAFYYYSQARSSNAETRYILAETINNTVINTISGAGQVSASSQIEIQSEIIADILEVKVVSGQKVSAGEVIAQLDDADVRAKVRQAKNSLDSARANLNAKLAGLSAEEITVNQKSLDSSKLSYENAQKNLTYVQSANADNLAKAQLQVDNAVLSVSKADRTYTDAVASSGWSVTSDNQDLDKAYSDAKNTLASAQIALRSALVSADNILEKNHYNNASHSYKNYLGVRNSASISVADTAYERARVSFLALEEDYETVSVWDKDTIGSMLKQSQETASLMQSLASAVSNVLLNSITASDFSQSVLDSYKQSASSQESAMIAQITSLQSASRAINSAELGFSSGNLNASSSVEKAKSDLESANNSLISAQNALKQATLDAQKSLDSANNELASKKNAYESAEAQFALKIAKPREVELASYYLQISLAESNYQDALDDANEAEVKAPIAGIIAQVSKKAGDRIGEDQTLATIITEEKVATISLNEVDVVQVEVGQKATLTFSAIEDLSLTGTVVEVNSVGTVSQGVVSYDVKIVLDTQDDRIKPQMTVSAEIAVAQSIDVITVPNGAIKIDDSGLEYVEVLEFTGAPDSSGVVSNKTPEIKYVVTGLADDTNTEIKSGLEAGVYVVARTVTGVSSESKNNTQSAASLLGGSAGTMRGGGMNVGGPPGM